MKYFLLTTLLSVPLTETIMVPPAMTRKTAVYPVNGNLSPINIIAMTTATNGCEETMGDERVIPSLCSEAYLKNRPKTGPRIPHNMKYRQSQKLKVTSVNRKLSSQRTTMLTVKLINTAIIGSESLITARTKMSEDA